MDTKTTLTSAEAVIKPYVSGITWTSDSQIDAILPLVRLRDAVGALVTARWGYLSALTGVDHPGAAEPPSEEKQWARLGMDIEHATTRREGAIELIYTFCSGAALTNLRLFVPYSKPEVESVCDIIPSATLFERETIEILGVNFTNTPTTEHLILPDSWPEGVYPLRKSFTGFNKTPAPDL